MAGFVVTGKISGAQLQEKTSLAQAGFRANLVGGTKLRRFTRGVLPLSTPLFSTANGDAFPKDARLTQNAAPRTGADFERMGGLQRPLDFELGNLDSLCQADTEGTRAMKDAKVYFEDLDTTSKEVIIDLFVSILENKARKRKQDREHEEPQGARRRVSSKARDKTRREKVKAQIRETAHGRGIDGKTKE